jgi:hypothetical protein
MGGAFITQRQKYKVAVSIARTGTINAQKCWFQSRKGKDDSEGIGVSARTINKMYLK